MHPKPGIYEHYKGKRYRVIGIAKAKPMENNVVIYESLYENPMSKYWVRPAEEFLEEIERDNKKQPRFRLIEKD